MVTLLFTADHFSVMTSFFSLSCQEKMLVNALDENILTEACKCRFNIYGPVCLCGLPGQ